MKIYYIKSDNMEYNFLLDLSLFYYIRFSVPSIIQIRQIFLAGNNIAHVFQMSRDIQHYIGLLLSGILLSL